VGSFFHKMRGGKFAYGREKGEGAQWAGGIFKEKGSALGMKTRPFCTRTKRVGGGGEIDSVLGWPNIV